MSQVLVTKYDFDCVVYGSYFRKADIRSSLGEAPLVEPRKQNFGVRLCFHLSLSLRSDNGITTNRKEIIKGKICFV